MEPPLAGVCRSGTRQVKEVRVRWAWTEPTVWTDRMLTTLEDGVKGGCWYSLIDKVYRLGNLESAFAKVQANGGAAGVDHQTPDHYGRRLEENLARLQRQLREGTYRPQAIRRVYIPKPGAKGERRPLGIPTVTDRIAQTALRNVVEPIFEREFAEHSYGFRPGRGCKDALRRVDALLKAGYTHVVDADLKGYFDSIPKDRLLQRVARKVSDGRVLSLIEAYLNQDVMEGLQRWTPETGTPQGAVISPLLANIYLDPLDHLMAEAGFEMVRYADDFVILCRTAAEAQRALAYVEQWTAENGLTLHPEKTRVVDSTEAGFVFLGYRFVRHRRYPSRKSMQKFKDAIRAKTRRNDGRSLAAIVQDVNRTLRGWFAYFQHSSRGPFRSLDGWIRMRLRSILRRRRRLRGRGRGRDHQRWPNAYFREYGLFDLQMAHDKLRQSLPR